MKYQLHKDIYRPIILTIWGVIIIVTFTIIVRSGIPLHDYPHVISNTVSAYGYLAPILFVLLYAIRPLIFFPATILSLSAGLLFGLWKAIIILMIAENLSSLVSYSAGKYLGKTIFAQMDAKNIWLHKFESYFHHNEFITILILRLVYAPFDLVGYFAGASNIRYSAFALATIIGIIPGLTTIAFLGGSATHPMYLILALTFFVLGIGISKLIKFRYSKDAV
jgi:uncharacterized membrane protein YdjX (TVP38/TMEM64 family)